jgi:hypothetical protein
MVIHCGDDSHLKVEADLEDWHGTLPALVVAAG